MSTRHLRVSVTFLQPTCHARLGKEDPAPNEWPPSPLRLFQAMVAGAAVRWAGARDEAACGESAQARPSAPVAVAALHWLENLCESSPPIILAPRVVVGAPVPHYVPNNSADLVAAKWSRGDIFATFDDRTRKFFRPTHMQGGTTVHYLWPLDEVHASSTREHIVALTAAARCIVALGWGIDAAIGDAGLVDEVNLERLANRNLDCWSPRSTSGSRTSLRLPCEGTFDALGARHVAFLSRVEGDVLTPIPPLRVFRRLAYTRSLAPAPRVFDAFILRPVDASVAGRKISASQYRAVHVAAMVRHAACEAAKADLDPAAGRDETWSRTCVAGHGPDPSAKRRAKDDDSPRLSYLSLPTIDPRGVVGDVRRVMIAELTGRDSASVHWARTRLSGAMLIDEQTQRPVAVLEPLLSSDFVLRRYIGQPGGSREWSTVTPVILPGYDDGKPAKRERLVITCLEHASLLAAVESIESRPTSWFPGVASSNRFKRPEYLGRLPAVHLRLRFREPMQGPIALGAGRHCGLGLFAAEVEGPSM